MNEIPFRRLLVYRDTGQKRANLAHVAAEFPLRPAGTLTYYGLNGENAAHFQTHKRALRDRHRAIVDDVTASFAALDTKRLSFQLVLEPIERFDPYGFVAAHHALVRGVAQELTAYQVAAAAEGNTLDLCVRYGSEMNDGNVYGKAPEKFKSSFAAVRTIFREHAPTIAFPFSPALRADISVDALARYWPGDDYVDTIGGTWFVHGESQRARGIHVMRDWYRGHAHGPRPLAIDEFGGAFGTGSGEAGSRYERNDDMLRHMFAALSALRDEGVAFDYGTLFMDAKKYGVDVTLDFLKGAD